MCGIVGSFGPPGSDDHWLAHACKTLRHRGPDDADTWSDATAGIVLGHTRLSVLDLSPAGRQPMRSACGRYHLIFNGEIYNHLELRRVLTRSGWRGNSDTETLLACLVDWGVERTLQAATGMFALALFDGSERRLILARDRFGEKPLYYGYARDSFVFASELRALRAAPGIDRTIDRDALRSYMRYGYVPAPRSIYSSFHKLLPGSWLELTSSALAARREPQPRRYWSAVQVALAGEANPLQVSDTEATDMLDGLLRQAMQGQMLADVPLGAFLSGGIDSSAIVALMQKLSSRPVRTFSIGFEEARFDESRQARLVADHLGTEHTELMLRGADALALVPRMPHVYDEPFADSSQLPTLLLAQLARRHVTVALSGDGGDELFGGYSRYFLASTVWTRLRRVPLSLRRGMTAAIRACSARNWDRIAAVLQPITPLRYRVERPGDRIHKATDLLACESAADVYRRLVSQWWLEPLVLGGGAATAALEEPWIELSTFKQQMMLRDATTYLPDDILVKVDRAAMAVSLETRVPLLDHRVFEFAWRLPTHMKERAGAGKWLLRQLLHRYVPSELVDRPKQGFAVPLDGWLRGPLRDWAEGMFDGARLRREAYLDAEMIKKRWSEHLAGTRNWHHQLWNVLMFEAWLEAGG